MKKNKEFILLIYVSYFLLCFTFLSCGEEEEPIFGSYQEIESGYKNCEPGPFSEQIETLTERGICWRANSFSECFSTYLTFTPESTFNMTSSGIRYYDDGTQEEGLQSGSNGTYTHEGNLINLYEETRFGIDTTMLRIAEDGSLNTVNESLINCELHGIYEKQ